MIHCFSYSLEMAKEYLNMGFYLGIGGVLTFNNAKKLKEVVGYMPLERIVLETDCRISPRCQTGKTEFSLNLPYVVEEISGSNRYRQSRSLRSQTGMQSRCTAYEKIKEGTEA